MVHNTVTCLYSTRNRWDGHPLNMLSSSFMPLASIASVAASYISFGNFMCPCNIRTGLLNVVPFKHELHVFTSTFSSSSIDALVILVLLRSRDDMDVDVDIDVVEDV